MVQYKNELMNTYKLTLKWMHEARHGSVPPQAQSFRDRDRNIRNLWPALLEFETIVSGIRPFLKNKQNKHMCLKY